MRTVATLTGVHPVTLRAWERRYKLIAPARTAGGHRLYTRADIDDIHRIIAAIGSGVSIGQVRIAQRAESMSPRKRRSAGPWASERTAMTEAIAQFDEVRLERIHNDALAVHSNDAVTRNLLLPVLAAVGERWRTSDAGIAEEHFLGVWLRNKLGARFHHRSGTPRGPRLLAACLPGEHHEVGLLMFGLAAHDHGYRVVMLGADVPVRQLVAAARHARADAIVLASAIAPEATVLERDLPGAVDETGLPVFVGGRASAESSDAIVAAGARPLGDDIDAALAQLDAVLVPGLDRH